MDLRRSNGKGKGKGKDSNQPRSVATGDGSLSQLQVQLRAKAFEAHGANTVWYFRDTDDGNYSAFSNFHELRQPYYVTVREIDSGESDGIWYPTSEQAYMAAKTFNSDIRRQISLMRSAEAKKFCRSPEFKKRYQRTDFWDICCLVMKDILKQKFADPRLMKMLLDTRDAYIMEGNFWGDDFWGKVVENGHLVGQNHLGQILRDIRDEFRREAASQARHREEKVQSELRSGHFPSLGPSLKTAPSPAQTIAPAPSDFGICPETQFKTTGGQITRRARWRKLV